MHRSDYHDCEYEKMVMNIVNTCAERVPVMNDLLSKNDYEEPECLLNMHPEVTPVPVGRIIDKLDSFLNRNDYDAAERHLRYWISEADACRDMRGKLTVLNEQIGLYRKTGKESECLRAVSEALSLADSMDIMNTVAYGTTLINAATGYKAFGNAQAALPLYRKARTIYESVLDPDDRRLGGLYNNMALTLVDLKVFREAEILYHKAVEIMEKQENGELEAAVTFLNLADLAAAESGLENGAEKIEKLLMKAETLLFKESLPKDGYYAFVCEKCAPVFGYYGFFLTELELKQRARDIYDRA